MQSLIKTNLNSFVSGKMASEQDLKKIAANLISNGEPWNVKISSNSNCGVFTATFKDREIKVNTFGCVIADSLK